MQHVMDIKQQGDWWRVVCSCGWRDPAKYVNSHHASQAKRVGPASAHIEKEVVVMPEGNDDINERLEEAMTALQRARTRFGRVYPDADRAEDEFHIKLRGIESEIEDLMADVDSR